MPKKTNRRKVYARKANIFDPDVRMIIKKVAGIVQRDGYKAVASRANVCPMTLYNWLNYKVLSPQSAKLFAVTRACGFKIKVEE